MGSWFGLFTWILTWSTLSFNCVPTSSRTLTRWRWIPWNWAPHQFIQRTLHQHPKISSQVVANQSHPPMSKWMTHHFNPVWTGTRSVSSISIFHKSNMTHNQFSIVKKWVADLTLKIMRQFVPHWEIQVTLINWTRPCGVLLIDTNALSSFSISPLRSSWLVVKDLSSFKCN